MIRARVSAILLAGVTFLVAGCATQQYLTNDVTAIKSDDHVLLQEDASYEVKRGIGVKWKEGLRAGVYRAELENQYGVFYRGPQGCVIQFMDQTSMGPFEGGVWVPKDRINMRPLIYYYFGYNEENAAQAGGLIVSGILESAKGDLTMMQDPGVGTFLDKLVVSNLPLKTSAPEWK